MNIRETAGPLDDDGNDSDTFKVYKSTMCTSYDIYLSKEVESDLNKYFDLIRFLEQDVKADDIVNVKLANYGGDLHTGVAIAHAMKNCSGTVISHVIANSYSMGAILAMAGDGLLIYPGNYLMFHNYSGGEVGKAGEIETSHAANKRAWTEYLSYFCTPFLTADEVKSIMDDRDLYVHYEGKGVKNRMKRHFTRMVS